MKLLFFLGMIVPLLVSCAAKEKEKNVINEPAGAGLEEGPSGPSGYLRVYSATESVPLKEFPEFQPHSAYIINLPDGSLFQTVTNRLGGTNEEPVRVKLPVGDYIVNAQSDVAGWVGIPVTIDQNLISSIHIDGSWQLPDQLETRNKLIRLPRGQVIGWYGDPIPGY